MLKTKKELKLIQQDIKSIIRRKPVNTPIVTPVIDEVKLINKNEKTVNKKVKPTVVTPVINNNEVENSTLNVPATKSSMVLGLLILIILWIWKYFIIILKKLTPKFILKKIRYTKFSKFTFLFIIRKLFVTILSLMGLIFIINLIGIETGSVMTGFAGLGSSYLESLSLFIKKISRKYCKNNNNININIMFIIIFFIKIQK